MDRPPSLGAPALGRKIADSLWAVYGGRDYLAQHGSPHGMRELAQHAWVGFDETVASHRATQWRRQVAPVARKMAKSGSGLGTAHFAKANLGLAALPTTIGDAEPDLVRVLGPVAGGRIDAQLAPADHAPARRTPRVSAFLKFMVQEVQALRPMLTG